VPRVQPLATALIRRPFHWGIVIITDAKAGEQIPEVEPDLPVTADDHGIIALVRHAQDISSFEDDFEWAEAEVLVRLLSAEATSSAERREIYRGPLLVPSGSISIGDADGEVIHPAHHGSNVVVVSVAADLDPANLQADRIQIDLLPSA
jgi:hypothetical protein